VAEDDGDDENGETLIAKKAGFYITRKEMLHTVIQCGNGGDDDNEDE